MEITPLSFQIVQERLLEHLRRRIHNGELTERSLARLTGISQPHIHNVLKGARSLSPQFSDHILAILRLSLLDLFTRDELALHLARSNPHRDARLQPVPVLQGLLGLHQPIPRKGPHREVHSVPLQLTQCATEPLIARLAPDPDMVPLFAGDDLVLLDQSEAARATPLPESYYVVRTPDGPCVRALRLSGHTLRLITHRHRDEESLWQPLSLEGRDILEVVLARIIWLRHRRRWEDLVA